MNTPSGYCDLRVERINENIISTFIEHGYNIIAVNTTLNCSLQEVGTSNRKKRKVAECNNAKEEETDLVPVAKLIKSNPKLTILNRLTIQISNIGQLHKVVNSRNFKMYNILAVEPLNEHVTQDIVTSPSVDIIACNIKNAFVPPKDYSTAVDKNIYFELSYGPMLISSVARQDTITLAHLLHIKGKSKNIIVSSGAVNKLDIRNPHDVMNLGILFGLSNKQSTESITQACHSVILKGYGRKLGKSAINMKPVKHVS